MTPARVKKIIATFEKLFPDARTPLRYNEPWQFVVAVILSAQCTDAMVNKITPVLFRKYKTIHALARANISDVEKIVHPTGFFHAKAKSIVSLAARLVATKGEIPTTITALLRLPGIGRKTANVVLGELYGIAEGIAVDTHVIRLSRTLGLSPSSSPEHIERDLMKIVPKKYWIVFPLWLQNYGRAYCPAKRHDHANCPLAKFHVPLR